MEPPDTRRNMYYSMDSKNLDLLSQLNGVRFLMVPKDNGCDDQNSHRNILADDSDWMMAEKNKPRSPPISPAVPWSRTTFDFISPDSNVTTPVKRTPETRDKQSNNTDRTPTAFILDNRVPDFNCTEHDGNDNRTPQYYRNPGYRDDERLLHTKRQLFHQPDHADKPRSLPNHQSSDKISQLLSFIEATSSNIPTSPVLRSVQPSSYHQPHDCHCQHSTSDHTNHPSKRRKTDADSFISSKKENIPRKAATCTCSMMEEHFLQMAETAYKNIRRRDTSPAAFEQFKRELTHTNDILKESVDIVNQIREMCEHRKAGNV